MLFKLMPVLLATVAMGAPLSRPSLTEDGLAVAPLGQQVVAHPGDVLLVCANDNIGGGDFDANDACAMATFGDGLFSFDWVDGISSLYNQLGVLLQPGLIGPDHTTQTFAYIPGTVPVFTLLTGQGNWLYSGAFGVLNPGAVPAFWIGPAVDIDTRTVVPEPSTGAIAAGTLAAGALALFIRRRS